jgi:hypothetical protein
LGGGYFLAGWFFARPSVFIPEICNKSYQFLQEIKKR